MAGHGGPAALCAIDYFIKQVGMRLAAQRGTEPRVIFAARMGGTAQRPRGWPIAFAEDVT